MTRAEANAKILGEIEAGLADDKGFLARSVYHQNALASVDQDCSKIARASVCELQDYLSELQRPEFKAEFKAIWSCDGRVLFDQLLPKVSAAIDAASFALTMRIFNTGLLSSLLDNLNISKFRADDTKHIYSEILEILRAFRLETNRRIDALEETLSSQATIDAKKNEFKKMADEQLASSEQRLRTIQNAMASCERSFRELASLLDRPLKLDVEVIDGRVVCQM